LNFVVRGKRELGKGYYVLCGWYWTTEKIRAGWGGWRLAICGGKKKKVLTSPRSGELKGKVVRGGGTRGIKGKKLEHIEKYLHAKGIYENWGKGSQRG